MHIPCWHVSRAVGIGLFAFLGTSAHASAQLKGSGLSVVLNDISYFISPFTVGHVAFESTPLSSGNSIYGFAPVTVVQEPIVREGLVDLFSNWTAGDDVFQDGFTSTVFVVTEEKSNEFRSTTTNTTTYSVIPTNSTVASGPYFVEMSTGALHQVYRLYDDFAGSFTTPLLQTPEGSFQPLSAQIAASATMTIGVPSRLYFTRTAEKPLAGVRIGVKVR